MTTKDVDRNALERCVQAALASKDQRRVEQVKEKLADETWTEVAEFCSYDLQMEALNLKPWESPPCWVDPADIETILAAGPGDDTFEAAKLTRRLLDAGLSLYEPDPITALRKRKR